MMNKAIENKCDYASCYDCFEKKITGLCPLEIEQMQKEVEQIRKDIQQINL